MRAFFLSCASIILSASIAVVAQKTGPESKADQDAVKLEATLITVPVIASDRGGLYITDLRKQDFTLYEDGVKQELAFFATVKEPFHVVLLIDTSGSTKDQIRLIQKAARAFVEQLQEADRVKVIAFADEVEDLSEFTSDQAALRAAIERARPGQGTRMYDAMQLALTALRPVEGRKAIVAFTDGLDMWSVSATLDDNLKTVEESGVIIYPIRYNTRATVEAIVRQQQRQPAGNIPGRPPTGTTPTTVPGETRLPPDIPGRTGDRSIPSVPSIILDRFPKDPRIPDSRSPDIGGPYPDPTHRTPEPGNRQPSSGDVYLDNLYRIADDYLIQLAARSGGKLHRADSLVSLPIAFEQIAAELRTQYSLGYYPSNAARDGSYRKIQVRTSRKEVIVRARPGYRARAGA